MKIVNSLKESGSETIENESKKQKSGFFSMLLSESVASLLGNMLADKSVTKAGKETITAKEDATSSFN